MREWLQILGLVLLVTLGLLLVQIMYDDFRTLRELGASTTDFSMYFVVTLPSFLAVVLPLALLVSVMFVLGKLHRANEFIALRAAGVGFMRITAPIWVVGVLACGLSWYLNASVVPWSVEESRTIKDNLQFRAESKTRPPDRIGASTSVAFDNQKSGHMWFFNRYSRFTGRGYGVTVSELDGARREVGRLMAAQAWPDASRGGWVFRDGRKLVFDETTGETLSSTPFGEMHMANYDEDPELMLLIDRRPKDLSFFELKRLVEFLTAENSPKVTAYAVQYHGLIADTLGPLIVIAIAIPFAISGVRVNPAVGVSKSIGLFFLYYIFLNIASSLATKHWVEPEVAAWLPNIGMIGLAVWFFAKLR